MSIFDITHQGEDFTLLWGHETHQPTITVNETGFVVNFTYVERFKYKRNEPVKFKFKTLDGLTVATLTEDRISTELFNKLTEVCQELEEYNPSMSEGPGKKYFETEVKNG